MSENLVGEKLGNYRLERLLGRGRMGVVYLARDEALLRPTAVKVLSWSIPESQGQNPEAWFIAEARNVARINHPHVVQIYGVARHGAHCYIAMEYVDGTTADVWIAQNGPFTVEQATELLIQTSGALQAAHDANVIHRDIKPENLLVGSDGNAKLGDFGMAMHTAKPRMAEAVRAGTPYYTAPEIWRGVAATAKSDIYALGATYYYLLTGRPPFLANDLQELVAAHLGSPVPEVRLPNGGTPVGCHEIIRQCMAKTPQQRHPSAQAVGWEARALLCRLTSIPPPSVSEQSLGSQAQRGQAMLPGIIVYATPEVKSIPAPPVHWHSFYGFVREPFARYEIGHAPYQGEPFLSLLSQLKEQVTSQRGTIVLLVGKSGIGRSSLARELLAQLDARGPSAHITCDGVGPTQTLAKRAIRALGVPPGGSMTSSNDVDALVEHCLTVRDATSIPVLVIDDCERFADPLDGLIAIALAAQLTNSFRLLLLASPDFEVRLVQSRTPFGKIAWQTVRMAALNAAEVAGYIASWFAATLAPGVAPILFTPDALLIIAYRSQGIPANINQMVSNMLRAAAIRERRVLDSWDAWTASIGPSEGFLATRPMSWPTSEVLQVLNQCRQQAGMQIRSG